MERSERVPKLALPAAAALGVGVVAFAVPANAGDPVRADFRLAETQRNGERAVIGTVTLDPADAAEDAWWFQATSWQGGEKSIVQQLEPVSGGTYRITEPIPVDGTWKTTLRLHEGRRIAGLPIFMPADPAIPAEEIPAQTRMTREFVLDKENLQREQKDDVPGWLTLFAYLAVGGISLGLIFVVGWGLARLDRRGGGPPDESAEPAGVGPAKQLDEGPKPGTRPAPPDGPAPRCPPVARRAQGSGRGRGRMSFLVLAHAGHWLVDLAFFVVPVGILLVTIVVLNRRGPKDG